MKGFRTEWAELFRFLYCGNPWLCSTWDPSQICRGRSEVFSQIHLRPGRSGAAPGLQPNQQISGRAMVSATWEGLHSHQVGQGWVRLRQSALSLRGSWGAGLPASGAL